MKSQAPTYNVRIADVVIPGFRREAGPDGRVALEIAVRVGTRVLYALVGAAPSLGGSGASPLLDVPASELSAEIHTRVTDVATGRPASGLESEWALVLEVVADFG